MATTWMPRARSMLQEQAWRHTAATTTGSTTRALSTTSTFTPAKPIRSLRTLTRCGQQHHQNQQLFLQGVSRRQNKCYSTLHQSSRAQSGRRRWGPVTIGLAFCPIITFGLGTWQVQRLRWKVDLIENLEERMSLDAIPLPRKVK